MCLSCSGVVEVLCVLPSSGVMWFNPSGLVLSRSFRGISRGLVWPPVMALLAVMSVDILMAVPMVAVFHHGCRELISFGYVCSSCQSMCSGWLWMLISFSRYMVTMLENTRDWRNGRVSYYRTVTLKLLVR